MPSMVMFLCLVRNMFSSNSRSRLSGGTVTLISLSRLVPSLGWAFSLNWAGQIKNDFHFMNQQKSNIHPSTKRFSCWYGDNSSNVPGTPNRGTPISINLPYNQVYLWEWYGKCAYFWEPLEWDPLISTSAGIQEVSHNAESKFTQNETKKGHVTSI